MAALQPYDLVIKTKKGARANHTSLILDLGQPLEGIKGILSDDGECFVVMTADENEAVVSDPHHSRQAEVGYEIYGVNLGVRESTTDDFDFHGQGEGQGYRQQSASAYVTEQVPPCDHNQLSYTQASQQNLLCAPPAFLSSNWRQQLQQLVAAIRPAGPNVWPTCQDNINTRDLSPFDWFDSSAVSQLSSLGVQNFSRAPRGVSNIFGTRGPLFQLPTELVNPTVNRLHRAIAKGTLLRI